MKKVSMRAMAFLAMFGLAAISFSGQSNAQDKKAEKKEEVKTVDEVMHEVNGKDAIKAKVKSMLTAKEVKWDELKTKTKEWEKLAADMAKNPCPKGDAKSWKSLTEKYAEEAKNLNTAAEGKKLEDAKKAFGYLADNKTCAGCHKPHK